LGSIRRCPIFKYNQNGSTPIIHNAPINGLIPGRRNGLRVVIAARDEELYEIIAIGNDTTIHNYGDISDDDDVAAEYDKFKFLMHNKMTSLFTIN
jgi:hypothetical protein